MWISMYRYKYIDGKVHLQWFNILTNEYIWSLCASESEYV